MLYEPNTFLTPYQSLHSCSLWKSPCECCFSQTGVGLFYALMIICVILLCLDRFRVHNSVSFMNGSRVDNFVKSETYLIYSISYIINFWYRNMLSAVALATFDLVLVLYMSFLYWFPYRIYIDDMSMMFIIGIWNLSSIIPDYMQRMFANLIAIVFKV